jgi:hypothetical protein
MMIHSFHVLSQMIADKKSVKQCFIKNGGIEALLHDLKTTEDEKVIYDIVSFLKETMSQDNQFKKYVACNIFNFGSIMYNVFKKYLSFRSDIFTIAINSFSAFDLENYMVQIMSIIGICDEFTFNTFIKLFARKNRTVKCVGWFVKDVEFLLQKNDPKVDMFIINGFTTVFMVDTPLCNSIKLALWKSNCRRHLFRISTKNSGAQYMLMRLGYDFLHRSTITLNKFDDFEQDIVKNSLSTSTYFGIHMMHIMQLQGLELPVDFVRQILIMKSYWTLYSHIDQCMVFKIVFCFLQTRNLDSSTYDEIVQGIRHMNEHTDSINFKDMHEHEETYVAKTLKLCKDLQIDAHMKTECQRLRQLHTDMVNSNKVQHELKNYGININMPDDFKCPITREVMCEPTVASDGISYEKSALDLLFQNGSRVSPITRQTLNHKFSVPNINLKKRIREYEEDVLNVVKKSFKVT